MGAQRSLQRQRHQRRERRVRATVTLVALAAIALSYVIACVDGVTPDCSKPATMCGPSIDGAADTSEAQTLPEGAPLDSGTDTAVAETGDPDADAGDEI